MGKRQTRSPALAALTASALAALGGRAEAQDAGAPRFDYRFSAYSEADIARDQSAGGTRSRYEVYTHQFQVALPLEDTLAFSGSLTFETMSGASPLYVMPVGNKPVQVMSGASINDKRADLQLALTRRRDHSAGTLAAGYSAEDDYRAANFSIGGEHELADTVTTLSAGAGYSSDTIEPDQGAWPTSVRHDSRTATSVFAGAARVLDAQTVVQASLSYTLHDGFLADPYKQAYITGLADTVPDARPDRRAQVAWLMRLRHFFQGPNAALHADYRYYHDDWKVDAHTVDVSWHQNFGTVQVVPGLRYYSQSQAYFYAPYYTNVRGDGLASSDYRLAPYGAISASLAASTEIAGWGTSLSYEHYESDGGYALGQVRIENPGLVAFDVVSLGLKKVF